MERQVSLRLPARLLDEIDRRAKRRRRPRAEVIRAALVAYLELPERALEGRPADRVRDLLTTEAVLTEAMHFVGRRGSAASPRTDGKRLAVSRSHRREAAAG